MIPCGVDDTGTPIADPVAMQPPAVLIIPPVSVNPLVPPAPGAAPPGPPAPGAVPGTDPNAIPLQGVLAAIQMMKQVNAQSNQRNAHMTQQQVQQQAATLQSNAQQLAHLTSHMGNLGAEVRKAITSNPTQTTTQATLSHPTATAGQSN